MRANADMPKIVDHEKQREKLAKATWRVIRQGGIGQASFRNIAEEAGASVGSIRHYFPTQSELLAFSMKLISDRINQRIRNIKWSDSPFEGMKQLLREILPMDEEQRIETEVWFAFTAKALVDPTLQPFSNEIYDELRSVFTFIIEHLIKLDLAVPDLDVEMEVERMYALIDGLAVHAILRPDRLKPDMIESVVNHHLKSLCR
ncbi:TetR/AcrR family transcriptional regulator [Laceyella putida]|uniref:TetR/AcrR family transcriptional regulator n=1 Tax=Laceyella putida TaxID=110101 RepID=A0ABW2RMD3_9BACL